MANEIVKGLKLSFGFILGLSIFFGIVYAVGFHSATDVVSGVFSGNYEFNGSVNFSEGIYLGSSSACNSSTKGKLMYNSSLDSLKFCNGLYWASVVEPATSCLDLYNNGVTTDGYYSIDVDGSGSLGSMDFYCDMTTEGGGWTLVAGFEYSGYTTLSEVNLSSNGYLNNTVYGHLSGDATHYRAEGVDSGSEYYISRSTLSSASSNDVCQNLLVTLVPRTATDTTITWGHKEGSGCLLSGADYSGIGLTSSNNALWNSYGAYWQSGSIGGSTAFDSNTESKLRFYVR